MHTMNRFGKYVRGAMLGALLAAGAGTVAQAQQSVWNFSGNCIDCADFGDAASYPVTATLTLTGYLSGALNDNHFVSFVYNGSNLIDPYTVNAGNFGGMMGILAGGPSQTFSLLFGESGFFTLGAFDMPGSEVAVQVQPGLWATCPDDSEQLPSMLNCIDDGVDEEEEVMLSADYGNQGAFVLQASTTVPEPSTYALMAVGLGVVGVVTRRRQRQ
ncbi:MAG: PEP-CTERM sorting domain-containing protein [Gemmatimonadaceae bacterium]|nr:PEP-CTERM sorting domain-containing protein [Gemmatimonadaceae bacterium]